jgi:GTP-binding protein HflX
LSEHLDELARLADTAGVEVAGRVRQLLEAPTARYFIGPGKVAEVKRVAGERGATLVVFDNDLTPAQGKALEAALGIRVMDRTELILDIFAFRARSLEAKLQVELAQLEYLLPRLARMWVHLSRIRGGIGLRGPGETQLETDRRLIRHRISSLKRRLEKVARHRETVRAGRRPILATALVGYTNAGKSSLLRALTGADVLIEDRLFATLDTVMREAALGGARRVRFIDTVGFIRKLPHHLVTSFRATIEEAATADAVLHVIDAAHPDWEEHVDVVDGVLARLDGGPRAVVHVFNKMDRLQDPHAFRAQARNRYEHVACVSALRGETSELTEWLVGVSAPLGTESTRLHLHRVSPYGADFGGARAEGGGVLHQ